MPFAYLDIENPVCAWAVYRGKLTLPPNDPGFVSVWLTGLVRSGDSARYLREVGLEIVRAVKFPHNISRLRCIFFFETKELALRALAWGKDGQNHFQPDSLAELSFEEPRAEPQKFDANWISHSGALNKSGASWMESYWAGDPFPDASPHWETLCVGNLIVHDVEIRKRAYENLKSEFPNSLLLLEIGRQAAAVGSDLGMISPLLRREGNDVILDYAMNFPDADNPEFYEKLRSYKEEGHPINWGDIQPHFALGSFGNTPDLRPYRASWSLEVNEAGAITP